MDGLAFGESEQGNARCRQDGDSVLIFLHIMREQKVHLQLVPRLQIPQSDSGVHRDRIRWNLLRSDNIRMVHQRLKQRSLTRTRGGNQSFQASFISLSHQNGSGGGHGTHHRNWFFHSGLREGSDQAIWTVSTAGFCPAAPRIGKQIGAQVSDAAPAKAGGGRGGDRSGSTSPPGVRRLRLVRGPRRTADRFPAGASRVAANNVPACPAHRGALLKA